MRVWSGTVSLRSRGLDDWLPQVPDLSTIERPMRPCLPCRWERVDLDCGPR